MPAEQGIIRVRRADAPVVAARDETASGCKDVLKRARADLKFKDAAIVGVGEEGGIRFTIIVLPEGELR